MFCIMTFIKYDVFGPHVGCHVLGWALVILNCCVACFCPSTCLDYGVWFGPITGSQREVFSSWHTSCNSSMNSKLSYVHAHKGDNTLENKWNNALHSELRSIRSVIMALKKLLPVQVPHVGSVFIKHSFIFVRETYITQFCFGSAMHIHDVRSAIDICCTFAYGHQRAYTHLFFRALFCEREGSRKIPTERERGGERAVGGKR